MLSGTELAFSTILEALRSVKLGFRDLINLIFFFLKCIFSSYHLPDHYVATVPLMSG